MQCDVVLISTIITISLRLNTFRNGAVKALYWTGNQSALAASNWIFDQVYHLHYCDRVIERGVIH